MSNSQLIEQYQIHYEKDPTSKVFAPLSEAYRKMGLLKEALQVAQTGVKLHPNFSGGRVALARILLEKKELTKALVHLKKATELTPENILAHSLIAESYLQLKKPKDALKAFKMVLFLSPEHTKAQKAVKKLESLTADEYDADLFQMKPLASNPTPPPEKKENKTPESHQQSLSLDRCLSLIDAYIVRNDQEKALEATRVAKKKFPKHPEIQRRLKILQLSQLKERQKEAKEPMRKPEEPVRREKTPQQINHHNESIDDLNKLLVQIKERRNEI